jgi:SNF2 family DNA or RNA helicase
MQYSAKHNLCIYDGINAQALARCVEGAVAINDASVGVPCTVPNMQNMRALNQEAVSPILHDYDWPRNKAKVPEPFYHQYHMSAFMTLHPRCFNLSDMGTGKTLSTLWALDYMMKKGHIRQALVLAPLSTLYRVWENEIFTHFLSSRKVNILYGDRAKRLRLAQEPADFYIVNHDGIGVGSSKSGSGIGLGELAAYLRDCPEIDAVIVDEGSVYKDSTTDRYKILRQVIKNKKYVWWLTGTPVPVEPTNAYAQAKMVRKDFSESFVSFRERTMTKITNFKWAAKKNGYEVAAGILCPAIRYDRKDCLDLPEVMVQTLDAELSPAQAKAMVELKKTLKAMVGAGQVNAINEASLRTKLIQISCGSVYGPEHEAHKVDCAPRMAVLNEVIEQAGHKILIFASLTNVVNMLYSELKKNYTVERVTGDVSPSRRNEIFRDFQEKPTPRIIVADPGCMAHGLTLTAAATTIWYGPTDKPEIYQQANKRMDRPGQKNKMLIVRITATAIEREIYRRLDTRGNMQGLMLDLIRGE